MAGNQTLEDGRALRDALASIRESGGRAHSIRDRGNMPILKSIALLKDINFKPLSFTWMVTFNSPKSHF